MTTADQEKEQVAQWLTANPGNQRLDAISTACNLAKSKAGKALAALVRDGAVSQVSADDGTRQWKLSELSDDAEGTDTSEFESDAVAVTEPEDQPGPGEDDEVDEPTAARLISPPKIDPDPAVILPATFIEREDSPIDYKSLAAKCGMTQSPTKILTALWALQSNGALTCTHPFRADGGKWEVRLDGDGKRVDTFSIAQRTMLTDAPGEIVCSQCGNEVKLPGASRRTGTIRQDGKRKLAPGELMGMAVQWISQNPGEEINATDLVRELKAAHPDRMSNSNGAVRNILTALLGEMVEQISENPVRYRCLPSDQQRIPDSSKA